MGGTADAPRVVVDLTDGLVSCGCDERGPHRAEDGLCELCRRQAPGRRFTNAVIPAGAQWVFIGNFCDECMQWMVEITSNGAAACLFSVTGPPAASHRPPGGRATQRPPLPP